MKLGEFQLDISNKAFSEGSLKKLLENNGFELVTDKEKILVEEIKVAIIELIHDSNNNNSLVRNSEYLVDKLDYSYQHLSAVFSKHEDYTLEKYIIKHKIEKVKELVEYDEMTLSEIAFQLGYSSTQYLSSQFKAITGYSVTEYKSNPQLKRKSLDNL